MLEIVILFLLGRHIARIAKRKHRSPVGYVILLVFAWYGGAIGGAVAGAILAEAAGVGEDENMAFIIPGLLLGVLGGVTLAYLVVCSVSPLPSPRQDYDDYDDYDPPPRRRREDDEDDRPRSRRRDDGNEHDPRPRRRRREDDWD